MQWHLQKTNWFLYRQPKSAPVHKVTDKLTNLKHGYTSTMKQRTVKVYTGALFVFINPKLHENT